MAFTNTVTDIVSVGNGYVMEYGTFTSDGGTATGTITADATKAFTEKVQITDILAWGFASDGDTAVIPAKDVAPDEIKIKITANDTGDYFIIGKAK